MQAFRRSILKSPLVHSGWARSLSSSPSTSRKIPKIRNIPDDGLELGDFVGGPIPEPAPQPTQRVTEPLPIRKPSWLRATVPQGEQYQHLKSTVRDLKLATVCEEARCPNIGECWGGKDGTATATIMLMGDTCTRGCRFCSVKTSRAPPPLDPLEPENTAQAITSWGLGYVVLTSVDRDDVEDGGASHIAETVRAIKRDSNIFVEVLSPDFEGNLRGVEAIVDSGVDVFAHNIETVEKLTPYVRDRRAGYRQTLSVLEHARKYKPDLVTKTSLMLGCGEVDAEITQTLRDLREVGCQVVTFGQYLRPTKRHMKVRKYVHPDMFEHWKQEAESMGFLYVASGPLVRSSYKAGEFFLEHYLQSRQNKQS